MSTGASKNFATQMLPWIDMKQIYAPNSSKHLPIVPSFESIKIEYYTLTSMGHLKTLPLTKLIVLISTVCVCLIAKNIHNEPRIRQFDKEQSSMRKPTSKKWSLQTPLVFKPINKSTISEQPNST